MLRGIAVVTAVAITALVSAGESMAQSSVPAESRNLSGLDVEALRATAQELQSTLAQLRRQLAQQQAQIDQLEDELRRVRLSPAPQATSRTPPTAASLPPPTYASAADLLSDRRARRIEELEELVKTLPLEIRIIRRGTISKDQAFRRSVHHIGWRVIEDARGKRYEFRYAKDKERMLSSYESNLNDAKEELARLRSGASYTPRISTREPQVGDAGILEHDNSGMSRSRFEILRIIDEDSMLLHVFGKAMWIEGMTTTGLVDGAEIDLGQQLLEITGTTQYQAADGGVRTVFVAQAIPAAGPQVAPQP